eukprot:SM000097S24752  [mRNA]  locus=s97:20602:24116:+ [translate_table: standard]
MAEAGVPQDATRAEDAVMQSPTSPETQKSLRKRRARELDQLLRTRLKPPGGRLPASSEASATLCRQSSSMEVPTGKTSVVQEALALLGRPAAFVGCRSCHGSPRALFEAALDQLLGHERRSAGHYAAAMRCERVADFVRLLPDAAARVRDRWECERAEPPEPLGRPPPAVYLIFDNAELLRKMDHSGGASLLPALLKLPELAGLPNLSIILISSVGWDGFWCGTGTREPLAVHFPDYTNDELCRILQARHPGSALYSAFLRATLQPFSRACRRVSEIGEALEPLFAEYTRPVTESSLDMHLWSLPMADGQSCACAVTIADSSKQAALEFELPMWSKFLLMAAYVASRNPATTDADFFGYRGGDLGKKRRRRRRSSGSAEDRQEFELQEARLRGPATFPLRRLLAILRCMLDPDDELCADGGSCMPLLPPGAPLPADALMQLATLASIDLVARSGGSAADILSNSAKFRCTAPAELVHQVAKSLGFPLNRYLLYG